VSNGREGEGTRPAPQGYEALRAVILDRRDLLPRRIAQVAAYALDNPDEIAFGTAASIASAAGVQPSTLIRFAQQFGFSGFTSLQSVFRERLRERNSSYEERLSGLPAGTGEGGSVAILQGILGASEDSLAAMRRSTDAKLLDRAIETLAGAATIFIVARRRSYPVASYIGYALGKLNVRSQIVESASGLSPEIVSFATSGDAMIAISFAPYAPSTVELGRTAAASGVPVVAITDSAFSPLAQIADVCFEVTEADYGGFRSLAATMALALALSVGVAERRRKPAPRKGR
jgi:DNA-binding MurR/RpiR family transcriptional regulator